MTGNGCWIERYEDKAGEWRWRLQYENGDIGADSGEGYDTEQGLDRAIERVRQAFPGADVRTIDAPDTKETDG